MRSPFIEAVRSVSLSVPELDRAEAFYRDVWRLEVAARDDGVLYLRGTGTDHHLLALDQAAGPPRIRQVTLRARNVQALARIAESTPGACGVVERGPSQSAGPAGGQHLVVCDPHGRRYEIVHGDVRRAADRPAPPDQPQRLAHVVLNSHHVLTAQTFVERALGCVLADRTRTMAFLNVDSDHHSLALADADNDALNHIAFVMPSLDAVMRGGGRLRDAGHAIEWGPGRHGPGDNVFNYFIDPFGIVVEYTAEIEQIDDTYQPGGPNDWGWFGGRTDQWGISAAPSSRLKEAQRAVLFAGRP